MTFVSHLLEPSYYGNSCRGNRGQMKGSNLAFADAESVETPISAAIKIQPHPSLIQGLVFGLGSIKCFTKNDSVLWCFLFYLFFCLFILT